MRLKQSAVIEGNRGCCDPGVVTATGVSFGPDCGGSSLCCTAVVEVLAAFGVSVLRGLAVGACWGRWSDFLVDCCVVVIVGDCNTVLASSSLTCFDSGVGLCPSALIQEASFSPSRTDEAAGGFLFEANLLGFAAPFFITTAALFLGTTFLLTDDAMNSFTSAASLSFRDLPGVRLGLTAFALAPFLRVATMVEL